MNAIKHRGVPSCITLPQLTYYSTAGSIVKKRVFILNVVPRETVIDKILKQFPEEQKKASPMHTSLRVRPLNVVELTSEETCKGLYK